MKPALLLLLALLPAGLAAEPALSLSALLEAVRAGNSELKAAASMADAADSMALASWSLPDPQVGLTFNDLPRPGLDLGQATSRSLDLSQELPFPGKQWLVVRSAEATRAVKQAAFKRKRADLELEARQAFWGLYVAEASAKAISRAAQSLGELVAISERRNRLGQVDRMGQLMDPMARMERASLLNQMSGLGVERRMAQLSLNRLMGRQPEETLAPLDAGSLKGLFQARSDKAQLKERALKASPEVLEALVSLAQSRAKQDLAWAGWLPDFMAQYSLVEGKDGMQAGMAMVKMNVPLWFTRPLGEANAAGHEAKSSESMAQSARQMTQESFEAAWSDWESAAEQWQRSQGEILPQAAKALDLALSGYKSGTVGTADALNAVQAYVAMNLDDLMLVARAGRVSGTLDRLLGE